MIETTTVDSGAASPKFGGQNVLTFGEQQYFCLGRRFAKHKLARFAKNLGGMALWAPPWLRLCRNLLTTVSNVPAL